MPILDLYQHELLRTFFDTHNGSDEKAHLALLHPDVGFYGAASQMRSTGFASYLGIWRGAKGLGVRRAVPLRVYGLWPEVAMLVRLEFDPARGRDVDSIWHFAFAPDGRVRELSILWNPTGSEPF